MQLCSHHVQALWKPSAPFISPQMRYYMCNPSLRTTISHCITFRQVIYKVRDRRICSSTDKDMAAPPHIRFTCLSLTDEWNA